jgi:heme/copper-type cytochrome/quinol oxidase subunit 4
MALQERNILLVYILSFVTVGIYFIYWLYKTKNELKELGANIPSFILFFIPIANIYWLYKYTEGWLMILRRII